MEEETITECKVISSGDAIDGGILTVWSPWSPWSSWSRWATLGLLSPITFIVRDSTFSGNSKPLLSFERASFNMKGCTFDNDAQNMDGTRLQTIERLMDLGSQGRNIDEQYSQKYLIESPSS